MGLRELIVERETKTKPLPRVPLQLDLEKIKLDLASWNEGHGLGAGLKHRTSSNPIPLLTPNIDQRIEAFLSPNKDVFTRCLSLPSSPVHWKGSKTQPVNHFLTERTSDVRLLPPAQPESPLPGDNLCVEQFESIDDVLAATNSENSDKIQRIFERSVLNGDQDTVVKILRLAKDHIHLNRKDEDGTTPLIHASCFGYERTVRELLESGAEPNIQDNSGWSPLMWASSNHHSTIVELLIDFGASANCKSSKGRTVLDFLNRDKTIDPSHSQKIMELLTDGQVSSENEETHESRYYAPSINDLESALAESDILYKMAMDNVNGNEIDLAEFQPNDFEETEEVQFNWDSLQLDQMFVFSAKNLDAILETVISHMKPHYSKMKKFIPANWVFLAARYSHYLAGLDMLSELMTKAISRIAAIIQVNRDDMSLLGFWLANCNLLLYYFKKDSALVTSTVQQQFELSEIIHEIYQYFVANAEKRLSEVIEDAMMNYLTLPGIEHVQFIKERVGFFGSLKRRNTLNHSKTNHTYRPQLNQKPVSPKTVNCILSSTLIVLQSYEVHPATIHYILNQLFYFLSTEIFNRILSNKEYCNRTKAMQIRMNLSVIEDWIHSNRLPSVLLFHFRPVIQALQYLQCVSSLPDLGSFVETARELDQLASTQMKHLAEQYRFEVEENPIQEEIMQYLDKLVQDTVNRRVETLSSMRVNGEYMANVVELKVDNLNQDSGPFETEPEIEIWKNSNHMLPFAIPTTSEMLTGFGRNCKEYVPQLPEDFIQELDNLLEISS